jgi:hypothetical protein
MSCRVFSNLGRSSGASTAAIMVGRITSYTQRGDTGERGRDVRAKKPHALPFEYTGIYIGLEGST